MTVPSGNASARTGAIAGPSVFAPAVAGAMIALARDSDLVGAGGAGVEDDAGLAADGVGVGADVAAVDLVAVEATAVVFVCFKIIASLKVWSPLVTTAGLTTFLSGTAVAGFTPLEAGTPDPVFLTTLLIIFFLGAPSTTAVVVTTVFCEVVTASTLDEVRSFGLAVIGEGRTSVTVVATVLLLTRLSTTG